MATMFLENLKASFSDFLRPNYYQVTFTGNIFGEFEFGFLTKGATFPYFTYNTTDVLYNNLKRNFANAVDYDPISFEFLVDDGLKILRFFDNWRKLVMNDGSRTFNYKEEYTGNIEVELWNRKQFMRAKVLIKDAFPVNIDNIPLAYDSNDQLMAITVSFRYDDVEYGFDDGLSIAGIRDTAFDLAQGTVGKGIDFIKDGIEKGANQISDSSIKDIFGGFGQGGGKFPSNEQGIADKSKEIFAGIGGGGKSSENMVKNAKSAADKLFGTKTVAEAQRSGTSQAIMQLGAKTNADGVFNTVTKGGTSSFKTFASAASKVTKFARDPAATARVAGRAVASKAKKAVLARATSFIGSKIKGLFGSLFG